MNLRPFTVLLILLMILQSGSSFADIHQFHPIPLSGGTLLFINPPVQKNSPLHYDCQHCCHCHGQGTLYLNVSAYGMKATPMASLLPAYSPISIPTLPPANLFHPPKT